VPTIPPERRETAIRPGLRGFEAFCELIDLPLEPYMRRISRGYFSRAREVVAVLPRGNWKTSLAAAIGLHHLMTTKGASVVIGAASVQQARVGFERMEGYVSSAELDVTVRHLELRFEGPEGVRRLRVIPSDGPRTHGLSCTLYVADEVWAWAERADLLTAMQTGLVKRPDSKLLAITTSSGDLDSPLGRWRRRAMSLSDVHRAGPVVEAKSRDLHWLEWSLSEQHELDNLRAIARCNPAPQIGIGDLRRQRESLTEVAFAQFHCCRWGIKESSWLPPGAWAACQGQIEFTPGERIHVGCDVGGSRSATAVVWLNSKLHVGCAVFEGEDGILEANEQVPEARRALLDRGGVLRPVARRRARPRLGEPRTQDDGVSLQRLKGHSGRVAALRRDLRGQAHPRRRRDPRPPHVARGRQGHQTRDQDRQGQRVGSDRRRVRAAHGLRGGHRARGASNPRPGMAVMPQSFCTVCRRRIPRDSR
jgi:hypothetical protein